MPYAKATSRRSEQCSAVLSILFLTLVPSAENQTGPVPGATDRGTEETSVALNKGLGLTEKQVASTPPRGLQRVPGVSEGPVRGSDSERLARLCEELTFNF